MNFVQLLNSDLKQRLIWLSCLLLGFILVVGISFSIPAAGLAQTEILWDRWGVPHIYGKDAPGMFQAFGWAQMQSHGDLILRLYGQARGRGAEYFGEQYLNSDRYVRTMGIPFRAKLWYQQQNPKMRGFLDAFATGINNYAASHPDKINNEVKTVLPVTGIDVLAHIQRVIHFSFIVNQDDLKAVNYNQITPGSNGWAIAPSHSTSGKAMLLANPHLPWSDLYLWYEAQLTAPGIDAYGAALVGMPIFAVAFNDNLGWTLTVNTHQGWNKYELKLSGDGYIFDNKVHPFQSETQIIKIKTTQGTRAEKLTIKKSIHGPVIEQQKKTAIVLRVVGLEQPKMMEQFWDMARASQLREFETALKQLQMPMFNIIYADRNNHILYLFNAQVPIHSQGDWKYWQNTIPGDTSKTLWTKTHPYSDLPRVLDPASGWVQNANDPPWTTTFPQVLNYHNYPAYMSPRFMSLRAQRSVKMLLEKPKISFEEMIANKFSARIELADRLLDDLITAARNHGSEVSRQAAEVLATWDRQTAANSKGAVLFAAWARSMPRDQLFATPWQENAPLDTPKGLADPKKAVQVLEAAATTVQLLYGMDVAWGEVARLRYGKVDLPVSGGPGLFGIFRVIDLIPAKDGKFQQFAGDSYIAAIEFSDPVKAKVLLTYGNATQPGSPHVGDQLGLYANNQLRPAWRTRKEVEANLEAKEVF